MLRKEMLRAKLSVILHNTSMLQAMPGVLKTCKILLVLKLSRNVLYVSKILFNPKLFRYQKTN